ncbi:MAG TPA: SpoIIE family protein phosphatase [Syntrophorhabdaceae bacterium]|nr:SpoIIE family protein phosphatase [Syntrophorhabdaceae bacterium]HQM80002.1 SpoIIE family protein phosphatase [Syntrophorhabdaceae bacterium]
MLRNKGIAFKLVLFFTLSSACIFVAIFTYNYFVSKRMIAKGIEENAGNLIMTTTNKIEAMLSATQKVPENIAYFLENSTNDEQELFQVLYAIVEKNPEIYGAAIAFEPYGFKKDKEYFAPYFYKAYGGINFKYLDKHYNYFLWDWYQIPRELEQPQWIEPYFGEGGGILMSSYSVPFYKKIDGKRQVAGVIVVDISLESLRDIVSSIKILASGYGFLISKNGTFVTHPMKELIMNETIFTIAEAREDAKLRDVGRKMLKGEQGVAPMWVKSAVTGKPCWMAYVPIKSSGWSLGVLFPQDELMADITNLNHIVLFLGIAGIVLLAVAVVFIARSITGPLRHMAKATEHIGAGNFDIELPSVKTGDEVGRLSEAISFMRESLKEYISELTEATASRERMESELKIAHDIQMSILPKKFPPYPERKEFDIYATIKPAREIGGDFYDFFFIDDEQLCFVIADVSGKGIPAALFMALTKTLIKAKSTMGLTTDKIISRVNEDLCIGNDMSMFVTVFCGILNVKTGAVQYTNGGHNPPLLMKKDGDVAYLGKSGELLVGAMEEAQYTARSIALGEGDSLFLYTDGVTEAMNERNDLFSEERLQKELSEFQDRTVERVVSGVMQKIVEFTGSTPQSDDITMMMITYKGE